MNPQDQQALIQFFGTMHAQAKQTDQMIVGSSQFLRPVSPTIQNQLETALRAPVVNQYQPPPEPPVLQQQIQTSQEMPPYVQSITVPEIVNNPANSSVAIKDSDEIVTILKEINLSLTRIGDILEKKNGTSKKVKNSQPS